MIPSVLTIIKMSELPAGWNKDFPFSALSVKPNQAALAKTYLDRMNPRPKLHLWEWAPFKDETSAKAWGRKMALACATFGATRFYVNCEAEWSGVEGFPRTDNPYANLFECMVSFYLHCPEGCELVYNGFSWARTSDGRKLHDADLIRGFYAWCPMIYGTSPRAVVQGFATKLDKYKGVKRIPMIGVGRIDKDGAVWGHWPETLAAIRRHKPDEVAFFFGNGAKPRYFESHPYHPSLVACAKELAK